MKNVAYIVHGFTEFPLSAFQFFLDNPPNHYGYPESLKD